MKNSKFQAARRENDNIYQEQAKQRLMQSVTKKTRTVMIGALAAFEDRFGHLWGCDTDNPTKEQLAWREIWEDVRTEILDRGNHNIRTMEQEIDQYTLNRNRYTIDFIMKGDR